MDIKNYVVFYLVFALISLPFFASCSLRQPSSDDLNCSNGHEVCISIDKVQPFTMGEPLQLNITVSSINDFSDLHVSLITHGGITVDGPQSWEDYLISSQNQPGMAVWDFPIKTNQPLTFKRILHFPSQEGYYSILTEVVNHDRSIDAVDNLTILLEHKGVHLIRQGTPLPPHTPEKTYPAYGP